MSPGEPTLLFTLDVESDWAGTTTTAIDTVLPRMLEWLDARQLVATLFVVGEHAAAVRRYVDPNGPHEIACHGLTHRRLTRLDDAELRREIEGGRQALQAEGYDVRGFRAPFLRAPRDLPQRLAAAGYAYDASRGSCLPSAANLARTPRRDAVVRLPPAALRGGLVPCSLTWLRLLHPFGAALMRRRGGLLFCHLHEFLEPPAQRLAGWRWLRSPVHTLHRRNSGATAWSALERALRRGPGRSATCSEVVASTAPRRQLV